MQKTFLYITSYPAADSIVDQMARKEKQPDSFDLLHSFWQRYSFHDMRIETISRNSGRVNIVLDEYVLSLTGAKNFTQQIHEFPDVWLYEKLEKQGDGFVLSVNTETGSFIAGFADIRLIRRYDFAILIPPVDG